MKTEELAHYSKAPLGRITSRAQKPIPEMKPNGLWVSVDDVEDESWPAWCRAEDFHTDHLTVRTRVSLHDDARILRLIGARDIDEFAKMFAKNDPRYDFNTYGLDWHSVAVAYQGIIIAPYVFARRFTHLWYYGWDCASGCIWDASAIADLVEVKPKTTDAARTNG